MHAKSQQTTEFYQTSLNFSKIGSSTYIYLRQLTLLRFEMRYIDDRRAEAAEGPANYCPKHLQAYGRMEERPPPRRDGPSRDAALSDFDGGHERQLRAPYAVPFVDSSALLV